MQFSGVLNLNASAVWSQSQTRRVQLDCETGTATCTINLPPLVDVFNLKAQEVELVINDVDDNALTNNITIVPNAAAGDNVLGATTYVINVNSASIILTIGTDENWIVATS